MSIAVSEELPPSAHRGAKRRRACNRRARWQSGHSLSVIAQRIAHRRQSGARLCPDSASIMASQLVGNRLAMRNWPLSKTSMNSSTTHNILRTCGQVAAACATSLAASRRNGALAKQVI